MLPPRSISMLICLLVRYMLTQELLRWIPPFKPVCLHLQSMIISSSLKSQIPRKPYDKLLKSNMKWVEASGWIPNMTDSLTRRLNIRTRLDGKWNSINFTHSPTFLNNLWIWARYATHIYGIRCQPTFLLLSTLHPEISYPPWDSSNLHIIIPPLKHTLHGNCNRSWT